MPEPLLALEAMTLAAPEGAMVFQDLDWRLERGARRYAPGGAGGGCTALLRLCAGIAAPDRGRILYGFSRSVGFMLPSCKGG